MHSDTADDSINGLPKELPQDSFLSSRLPDYTHLEGSFSAMGLVGLETNTQLFRWYRYTPALKISKDNLNQIGKYGPSLDNALQNNTLGSFYNKPFVVILKYKLTAPSNNIYL